MNVVKGALAGTLGGLAGALAMAAAMAAGKWTGLVETPAPLAIERELERRAGIADQTDRGQERGLAFGEHMAIGAAFGAGYGTLPAALGLPAFPSGPLYGLGVYALNYLGIGPGLALTPGAWDERPTTVWRRVALHLLYGTVTALVADRARRWLWHGATEAVPEAAS